MCLIPEPNLRGHRVDRRARAVPTPIGQPTILIVTPSRVAADETRDWAEALPEHIDLNRWRVHAVRATGSVVKSVFDAR